MTQKQLNEEVTVTCYRSTTKGKRRDMIKFYLEGMRACDGSERERYETIYFQLLDGRINCSDALALARNGQEIMVGHKYMFAESEGNVIRTVTEIIDSDCVRIDNEFHSIRCSYNALYEIN